MNLGGGRGMKIAGLVFAAIVLVLSIYSLITRNFIVMPYVQLFNGLMFLVLGIIQFRENYKLLGVFLLTVSAFSLYVSGTGFM